MNTKIKLLSSGFALTLAVCLFAACGGAAVSLAGAKLALEDEGCTVTSILKSDLPETFENHQDVIKSAYRVEKGTANDVYLVEFNTKDDAIDAYTSISSNKQRASHLIMYTSNDIAAGDAKIVWEAFTAYVNTCG